MSVPPAVPLLEVRDVTKSFGNVAAVQGVSFPLYGGEAHALVGENGAGKSTIVKMLAGVHGPDTGSLLVGGEEVSLGSPSDAKPGVSRSSTRSRRCSPTSPLRRTSSSAPSRGPGSE